MANRLGVTSALALLFGASFSFTSSACLDPDGLSWLDDEECRVGSEACTCTHGGGCDEGLTCYSGFCVAARCGDGEVHGDEQCDDANASNNDGCTNQCVLNVCGDGVLNLDAEACDFGSANDYQGECTSACTTQRCGDGFLGADEACDHGELNGLDGACTLECRLDDGTGDDGGGTDDGTPPEEVLAFMPVADAYVRTGGGGRTHTNYGDLGALLVQPGSSHAALIAFDGVELQAALLGREVLEAHLRLRITGYNNAEPAADLELRRMQASWSELGVTYACADDFDTSNTSLDCAAEDAWDMQDPYVPPYALEVSNTTSIAADQVGTIDIDLSDDLHAIEASGAPVESWILRSNPEGQLGAVQFGARESATPPVLFVTVR